MMFFLYFCYCLFMNTGVKLQIVSSSKSALQTKIAANFGFSPSLLVEVVDDSGTRITSGANSTLVNICYYYYFFFFSICGTTSFETILLSLYVAQFFFFLSVFKNSLWFLFRLLIFSILNYRKKI